LVAAKLAHRSAVREFAKARLEQMLAKMAADIEASWDDDWHDEVLTCQSGEWVFDVETMTETVNNNLAQAISDWEETEDDQEGQADGD
jgi:hypothetical protein